MDKDETTEPGERSNRGKVWAVCEKLLELFPFDYLCLFCGDAPAKAKWQIGATLETLGTDLICAEKPFRAEIEAAIRAVCAGPPFPTSPEGAYFLQLRSRVVFWFFSARDFRFEGRPLRGHSFSTRAFRLGNGPLPNARLIQFQWAYNRSIAEA